LALIFDKMNIDTNEVLAAAATKWNFLPFKPGLVGGHCIGVDPYYLAHKASSLGYHPQVILSGRNVNDQMSTFITEKVVQLLNKNNFKVPSSKVLLLGVTFKENCPDIRNSQTFEIYNALKNLGVEVFAFDPFANAQEVLDKHQIQLISSLATYDAIILTVAHDFFKSLDYASLKSAHNTVIYDTKGILDMRIVTARL
jgi:UDP-N-acetyl-D-galactosamine dehydrogenase